MPKRRHRLPDARIPARAVPPAEPSTRMPSLSSARATLAVPLLALLWGLNWPAVRILLGEIAPFTMRTMGLGLGALVLFAFARVRGQPLAIARTQWGRLAGCSLLSIGGFNLLVSFAQLAGTTSRSAALTYTMPIWAIALAWPVLGERPDARKLIALALGAGGLILLCVPVWQQGLAWAGPLLAVGGGMSWAGGIVFAKRFPVAAAPVPFTAWQLLISAVAAAVGMLVFEGWPAPRWLSPLATGALAYHVLLAMAFAYFLWFEVVAQLPTSTSALGTLMVPVVGITGAMTLLGERPSALDAAGFVLVLASATLALRGPATSRARATHPEP